MMLSVLPQPSQTVVMTAAFTGLRSGEIRGLTWDAYIPRVGETPGILRVLRSVWRGRVGEPKNKRSKPPCRLCPRVEAFLEKHRAMNGNPVKGPIFANGAGRTMDLDSLYRRQMMEPLKQTGLDWQGWHGFRRGLATNLERIGVTRSLRSSSGIRTIGSQENIT